MLYTHLGRIVAVLGLLHGSFSIYHSLSRMWAIQTVGPVEVERVQFLTQQFQTGVIVVLLALALGVLTEISRSVREYVIEADPKG